LLIVETNSASNICTNITHVFVFNFYKSVNINKRTILLQTPREVWQQFINFLTVTHQRPGRANLIKHRSVLPQYQNSRSEVSGILRNYVCK